MASNAQTVVEQRPLQEIADVTFEAMCRVEREAVHRSRALQKSKHVDTKGKDRSVAMTGEDKKAAVLQIVKETFGDKFNPVVGVVASAFVDLIVKIENEELKLQSPTSGCFGCFTS